MGYLLALRRPAADRHLGVGDSQLRRALLEPHPSRHHYQRPLPLDEAPCLYFQESVVVADFGAIRRECTRR